MNSNAEIKTVVPHDVPMQPVVEMMKAHIAELDYQNKLLTVRVNQLTEFLKSMGAEVQ